MFGRATNHGEIHHAVHPIHTGEIVDTVLNPVHTYGVGVAAH